LPIPRIHVWIKVLATDEKQCYYVTKPDPLLLQRLVRTYIVTTLNQAFLFIPNCGTAVGHWPPFLFLKFKETERKNNDLAMRANHYFSSWDTSRTAPRAALVVNAA